MSKFLRAAVILLLVAACGGGQSGRTPRNLDNACSILSSNPSFYKAFRAAERKYGVPVHVQMATIYQESKFKSDARTPLRFKLGVIPMGRQSSAYGYSQALDGTWKEYQRETGKRGARRNNIRDAADFMGWYMAQSKRELGIPMWDARNQYLAYHEGRTGYRKGTYNSKAWLLRVSSEVGQRARTYQGQLRNCRAAR
ncbi:MAG: transglycosylase SLT domain-containing protein [Pelagimonas sp.]|nr:transglycosylase SLT domain-containing protein [Pelagimonas sp.]